MGGNGFALSLAFPSPRPRHVPADMTPLLKHHGSRLVGLGLLALAAACSGSSTQVVASSGTAGLLDPQTAKIELGRKLLFDDRLSRPRGMACATCHDPQLGWGDGRPQGKGIQDHTLSGDTDGDGLQDHDTHLAVAGNRFKTILTGRNTPTVYNSHVFPNLFWDGRAGDLAHQSVFPFEGFNEMNSSWDEHIIPLLESDEEYLALFQDAFGDQRVSRLRAGDALGAYEATISVFDTPYDAFLAGDLTALTPEADAGRQLFFGKAGCATCHPAPLLTNMGFANLGVPEAGINALYGNLDYGHGKRDDLTVFPHQPIDNTADYMKFKVPQLRMVALTGPYMHNGAMATLEEVVEFLDAGGGPDLSGHGTKDPAIVPLGLTAQEKSDLVAFLRDGLTGTPID